MKETVPKQNVAYRVKRVRAENQKFTIFQWKGWTYYIPVDATFEEIERIFLTGRVQSGKL